MTEISGPSEIREAIETCFTDPDIRNRTYYPDFRRAWEAVLEKAQSSETTYFDVNSESCFTVHNEFAGISFDFHIDQLKIADWFEKELVKRKKVVFFGKKLKRNKKTGELMFHEAVCGYDPEAPEPALTKQNRNIIACALPHMPLRMQIIYGNKFVEKRFNPLRRNTLDVFFIGTDYVPAFLATPFELALYLFLMDYCIIKTNIGAKDEDVSKLLHIMRPSPMLRIKGLA